MNITEALTHQDQTQDKIKRIIRLEDLMKENDGLIPERIAISLGATIRKTANNGWIGADGHKVVEVDGQQIGIAK